MGPTAARTIAAADIAAFAEATGTPWSPQDPAPATFPFVIVFDALTALLADPGLGLALQRTVHGEQRFEVQRPIRVGDVVAATMEIESVRSIAGADIMVARCAVTTQTGELLCVARSTLVHRQGGDDD